MRTCVFSGSFDPITVGHLDVIRRAAALFDRVIVAVLHNPAKHGVFTIDERLEMIRAACAEIPNAEADAFSGLMADYVRKVGADCIVRGLRETDDFVAENRMGELNYRLNPQLETIYLMSRPEHRCISSSAVREIAAFGGMWQPMVPEAAVPVAEAAFRKAYNQL